METVINGQTVRLEMDYDAVVNYELVYPEWSIMDTISKAAQSKRISDMNLLTSFLKKDGINMGENYVSYLKEGLTVDDMLEAFREGLVQLGFIPEADPSAE